MKTMILKELKWSLKWALIVCGAYSLCLLSFAWANGFYRVRIYEDILSGSLQIYTWLGLSSFGFLLGLLQILPESRRHAWSFLVHRPLSRGRVFWSKVIAGQILYFGAILVPSAVFLLWFLAPGVLPIPFEWPLFLPFLVNLLTGVFFYFAGLLVGLREARWYGSRLWPLLAALFVSFFLILVGLTGLEELTGAVLGFAIFAGLLLAAYGSFWTGGRLSGQPKLSQWGLALSLMTGGWLFLLLCGLLAVGFGGNIFDALVTWSARSNSKQVRPLKFAGVTRSSNMVVTRDGQIITLVTEMPIPQPDDSAKAWEQRRLVSILDETGSPARELQAYVGKKPEDFPKEDLLLFTRLNTRPSGHWRFGYLHSSRYVQAAWTSRGVQEKWRFLPRKGRFFGYSCNEKGGLTSYVSLGSIGPDGFTPPYERSEVRFAPSTLSSYEDELSFYLTKDELYWIDLDARKVRRLFSAPKGLTILDWATPANPYHTDSSAQKTYLLPDQMRRGSEQDIYLLTSDKHLRLLNRDKGPQADIDISILWDQLSDFTVGRTADGKRYFLRTNQWLTALSADGQVLARHDLPRENDMFSSSGMVRLLMREYQLDAWASISVPPIFQAASYVESAVQWKGTPLEPSGFSSDGLLPFLQKLGGISVLPLLALLFCNRRLRKYPFSRGEKITWRLLTLLMGPGALLALYALYDWPAKEPCPACGKMRVVNRENCEFCGAPFTPPAPTGKEMFGNDE